jgi:hypothetical protein
MTNRKIIFSGMLAVLLVFGLAFAACKTDDTPGGGGAIPEDLIGSWYTSLTDTNPDIIFTANSVNVPLYSGDCEFSVNGKEIKIGAKGTPADYLGTFCTDYTVADNVLTRTNPGIINNDPLYRR